MRRDHLVALGCAILIAGCVTPSPPPGKTVADALQAADRWGAFGIDMTGMDTAVHPGDDFWDYVNGNWARRTTIPLDRSVESQVSRLGDLAATQVRAILDELAARRGSLAGDALRVARFWSSLQDRTAIEALGAAPLLAEIAPVFAARDHSALAREMGRLQRSWTDTPFLGRVPRYVPALFHLRIIQDSKHPDRYVAVVRQRGLGLPDRRYYLADDADSTRIQEAYRSHIATMLRLVGTQPAEADRRAALVYAFERRIADGHWSRTDANDPDKTYNPVSPVELARIAPDFDWSAFLEAAGAADRPSLIAAQPGAFAAMARTFSDTPLPILKDWLTVRLAKDRAAVLPGPFADAEFAFSGGVLGGTAEAPPHWLQAVEATTVALADAVAKPYVERHFTPGTKAAIEELVVNVRAAMDRRLATLDWMQPATRQKAREKLAAFKIMVGYPDSWRSYEGLNVRQGDAYGNFVRAAAFDYERRLRRIDQPADRREWQIFPMTANAVADSINGQITFAAAYLQPPHFDPRADAAVNYGAIGFVIGHEISHHFDDVGSRFDPQGRLAAWWTGEDLAAFRERTQQLAAQYGVYEALPGLKVNGAQTLNENIADNAGLAIAYDAYRLSLGGHPAPVIGGFTGDQRFFIARAQINRALFRPEELRRGVLSGNYAPSRYRTWSVRNHDAWYTAFGVAPGHRMYLPPDQRVKIWESGTPAAASCREGTLDRSKERRQDSEAAPKPPLVEGAGAGIVWEARDFMQAYGRDISRGRRAQIAARYHLDGACLTRDGRREILTHAAIQARYADPSWSPPHAFHWSRLAFRPLSRDEVLVEGEFLLVTAPGSAPVVYSYRGVLRRTGAGLRILIEEEARKR